MSLKDRFVVADNPCGNMSVPVQCNPWPVARTWGSMLSLAYVLSYESDRIPNKLIQRPPPELELLRCDFLRILVYCPSTFGRFWTDLHQVLTQSAAGRCTEGCTRASCSSC